jgi:hypothetical protein
MNEPPQQRESRFRRLARSTTINQSINHKRPVTFELPKVNLQLLREGS